MAARPPFAFVLDELQESALAPRVRTRPMFGSLAVYIDDRIVFILRRKDKAETVRDNGVWVAMQPQLMASVVSDIPCMRPIEMFQQRGRQGFSGWLNIPEQEDGFEEAALHACRLVIGGDFRIGKLPKSKAVGRRALDSPKTRKSKSA